MILLSCPGDSPIAPVKNGTFLFYPIVFTRDVVLFSTLFITVAVYFICIAVFFFFRFFLRPSCAPYSLPTPRKQVLFLDAPVSALLAPCYFILFYFFVLWFHYHSERFYRTSVYGFFSSLYHSVSSAAKRNNIPNILNVSFLKTSKKKKFSCGHVRWKNTG